MKRLLLSLVVFASLLPAAAFSATQYVSDQLTIYMRSGPGLNYSIRKSLKSGDAVKVVERDRAAGWARVRTKDGKTGWLLIRQISSEPVARDRLSSVERKLSELQAKYDQARKSLNSTSDAKSSADQSVNRLQNENQQLTRKLEQITRTAENAIAINKENKRLKDERAKLERELRVEQQQNQSLKDQSKRDWFLVGAGVVVLGILIGLILPKLRRRKSGSWDSL